MRKRICTKKVPLLVNFASEATHVSIYNQRNVAKQNTSVPKLVQHSIELARAHALIRVNDQEILQKKNFFASQAVFTILGLNEYNCRKWARKANRPGTHIWCVNAKLKGEAEQGLCHFRQMDI